MAVVTLANGQVTVPIPANKVGFGIGTYQPLQGNTTTYGSGWATQAFQLVNPFSGVYGGQYGYVVDMKVRPPNTLTYIPAQQIGSDSTGTPVVRGYPQMTWTYTTLRPDYWYYFLNVYNQSGRVQGGFQYLVLVQYPDWTGTGSLVQSLARMDPPTHSYRTVGAYYGVQLKFVYLSQSKLTDGTPIQFLS